MNDKLNMLRTITNRLSVALGTLTAIFVPGAMYANSYPSGNIVTAPMAAFMVGVIGGFVGLQRRLKALSDDDLTLLANSWVSVSLSPLVGGILAVLTYVLFVSGLMAGTLFPKFVADAPPATGPINGLAIIFAVHGEAVDYAKLLFWCFIAGFAERLVPDKLKGLAAGQW